MSNRYIAEITEELNSRAHRHLIGRLQEHRASIKGLSRLPSWQIFAPLSTHDDYAFHLGGRTELQFNVGVEGHRQGQEIRYGVAFSFETSRSLPSIEVLIPKVRHFNDFLQLNGESFADMRMWHYSDHVCSTDYAPAPIPHERVTPGTFLFMGKRQFTDEINFDAILGDFDRLLPLYLYVESSGQTPPTLVVAETQFAFLPGCSSKATSTVATLAQTELDVTLRHNMLQEALYHQLAEEYGRDNVGTELASGIGTSVDLIVRSNAEYWFYEIKTALSPRACLRQAIGQLLEYAFWPGAQTATRLIVVGESPIDGEGAEYLSRLKRTFSLPIEYLSISV